MLTRTQALEGGANVTCISKKNNLLIAHIHPVYHFGHYGTICFVKSGVFHVCTTARVCTTAHVCTTARSCAQTALCYCYHCGCTKSILLILLSLWVHKELAPVNLHNLNSINVIICEKICCAFTPLSNTHTTTHIHTRCSLDFASVFWFGCRLFSKLPLRCPPEAYIAM